LSLVLLMIGEKKFEKLVKSSSNYWINHSC
jgi:hypothetical protein